MHYLFTLFFVSQIIHNYDVISMALLSDRLDKCLKYNKTNKSEIALMTWI